MKIPVGFRQLGARDNEKVNLVLSNKRRATLKTYFDH
jgi:hypothetical protein